jgi:lysozyme
MSLRTTRKGIDLIKQFEGRVLKAYKCPAGVLTIGYGHTNAAGGFQFNASTVITAAQALQILRADIDKFEDGVERLIKGATLSKCQFDAIVSLAFNIGLGAFGKSTLLKRIKAGNLDAVPAEFMKWNKVKGKAVAGLTRRRRAEAALWRDMRDVAEDEAKKIEAPEAMPQAVDEPAPPPKTGVSEGTIIAGGAGAIAPTVEAAKQVKDAVETGTDIWTSVMSIGPWVALAAVVVGVAVFVFVKHRKAKAELYA